MIRVGIIGLGMMGRCHLEGWGKAQGAEVVAVADADPKRAAGDLSGGWGNIDAGTELIDMDRVTGTTDPHELIAMADVDVVDVCVPTPFHAELAIAALEAGKHVVCEKPMARTAEDARRIAAAAAASPGMFMPGMCIRFWPQYKWLKDIVDSGAYGRVLGATFKRMASMPPGWFGDSEMSGGAALDLHLHDTDFVQYLLGMPKAVASCGYSKTTDGVDHIVTRYVYDDIPVVTAEGAWCMDAGYGFNMSYMVNFENATADFDFSRGDEPLLLSTGGEKQVVTCEGSDGYEGELAYFAECITAGTPPTIVTAEQAAESIRIVEAEIASIQSGAPVSL
ncbi:MAG: Gfo/Idh/MocA family oxidoreductase [Phycisphaerae bacterium]|jgi:predicted dehydrogenase|nr:Gfo/Idh/MocA family oxidoreductase [Phycisphaerae bacterium]